ELLTILGFEDIGKNALLYGGGGGGGDGDGDRGGGEKNSTDGFVGCEIEGFLDFFIWNAPSV
ncbi:hypothetical protein S83_065986, partial [Arachis hypogaea]